MFLLFHFLDNNSIINTAFIAHIIAKGAICIDWSYIVSSKVIEGKLAHTF